MPPIPVLRLLRALPAAALLAALLALPAAAAPCIADAAGLRAALALPAAEKAGRRFCLAPGRYDMAPGDFAGAFSGLDPARPVTFEAADPADPPVLNMWAFVSAAGEETGDAVLRDLVFDLSDMARVGPNETGFRGHRMAVELAVGGPTRNVVLERIRITGGLAEARTGGTETAAVPVGVFGTQVRDVVVRDSRFERILNGIVLGGERIVIEGNRMRHGWGDMIRLTPQVLPDGGCAPTRDVTVRRNLFHDMWGNFRMHPDFIHLLGASRRYCDVGPLLVEQNLVFPGLSGALAPARPTGLRPGHYGAPPAALPETSRRLHVFTAAGRTRLPPARCAAGAPLSIGLQRSPDAGGPVRVAPAAGDRLTERGRPLAELVLAAPWETWHLRCNPGRPGTWLAKRELPSIQGVFANPLKGPAGYRDITVRHNIFWITAPKAVGFGDPDNAGIAVLGNSFLMPWPGDLNGDGRANTYDDGFNEGFAVARIILEGGQGHRVLGNVATAPLTGPAPPGANDAEIRIDDGGRRMIARFAARPGPQLLPTTPAEAVALARPVPGGPLDGRGLGAVAVRPADDPVDWSWAAEPW